VAIKVRDITPLRYPGGKSRLGPWFGELMRHNNISGGSYVEPYAGGAGAAMYLLLSHYVNNIYINDIDPAIYAFWFSVLNDTDALIEKIENTELTVEEWRFQKDIYKNHGNASKLDLGFATFFLNRTNRSGILTAGIIGGINQNGNYKMDARYNRVNLIERIRNIADYNDNIHLYNLDALDFIDTIKPNLSNKALIYFDPPYYEKGSQLYRNHYNHNDHSKISKTITSLKTPWTLTYDNCQQIKKLYKDSKGIEFSLNYSTTNKKGTVATEAMFFGNIDLHEHPKLVKS